MLDKHTHRDKLINVLQKIYSDRFLAPILGFKGGTALYFFYDLTRFSVDLDFDLLKPELMEDVHMKILEYVENMGEVRDEQIKFFGNLIAFSYEQRLQNLKIEISKREVVSGYELKNFFGKSILVMKQEDMFANKLLALYERMAVRDIFDVHFMFDKSWVYNYSIIEKRTELTAKDFFEALVSKLEGFDDQNILHDFGYLIEDKQKSWVKNKMKEDTLFFLRGHLSGL